MYSVKFPVPGPISSTSLFKIFDICIIFIIFLSIKKFCPKLFLVLLALICLKILLLQSGYPG